MKTLYTGHVALGDHEIYSFIYADTLLHAERHLTNLLTSYVEQNTLFSSLLPPLVKVISRPNGWNPPDGYYLPGTSKQYALKYPEQEVYSAAPKAHISAEVEVEDEVHSPLVGLLKDQEAL